MILNKVQAEAVYSAMCALNNVGGFLRAAIDTEAAIVRVEEDDSGVHIMRGLRTVEQYTTQADFAAAYGLN